MHRHLTPSKCRIRALMGGVALILMAFSGSASGQTVEGLRGLPNEEELAGIGRRDPNADLMQPIPPYRPVSPGAVPGDNVPADPAASIFDDSDADAADVFSGSPPPSSYRPSTARARDRADGLRLNSAGEARPAASAGQARPASPAAAIEAGENATAEDSEIALRAASISSDDQELAEAAGRDNIRVEGIESRGVRAAGDPYAPLGIRTGSFILNPSLQQGLTATTNASQSPNGGSAILSETTLRLNAVSDWSRHSASLDLYGIARESISGEPFSELELGADAALDLDLSHDYRLRAELGYRRRPEDATSPVVIVGTAEEPLRQDLSGSLALSKDIGKLRLAMTGAVDRQVFSDAELSTGGVLSQEERNSTLVSATIRTGYEVSPALIPFVEAEVGRRFYDLDFDSAGYERSANRYALRAGVAFDFTEKLFGEISAGYLREEIDDSRLVPIAGPTLRAALNWSPVRGTLVRLEGDTFVEGTTSAGSSGSILYSGRLSAERELRANLTGNAAIGLGWRDYASSTDSETILYGEAGLTWWMNRYAGISGRLRHERFTSSLPNRDSETTSAFLGLTLRR